MIDLKALQFGLGATVAWLLLCILMFDRWFFFSPLGIILAFGLPVVGWLLWWRYAASDEREISPEEQQLIDKGADWVQWLKNRIKGVSVD